jgi:hypothetical protein
MVIFRIIRNLIRLGLNLIWWPFLILGRNMFLLLLIVIVFAVYVMLQDRKENAPVPTIPADTVTSAMGGPPKPPPIIRDKNSPPPKIDVIRIREDGNSNFARDLIKEMSEPERSYYSQIFYWVMNHGAAGKPVQWSNLNTHGTLTPDVVFINPRGYGCRKFTETLKVHEVEQTLRGTACQKGGGAWCKLPPNATPGCGLGGYQPSLWDSMKRSLSF